MYSLAEIIERLSKSMQDHETDVIRQSEFSELSLTQIHYLDAIRHLGKPTISELAHYLTITKPTATIALERLKQDGYISRVQSLRDRRVTYIHLTKRGLKISNLHDLIHSGYAEHFKEALDKKELNQLVSLLNKVLNHLEL